MGIVILLELFLLYAISKSIVNDVLIYYNFLHHSAVHYFIFGDFSNPSTVEFIMVFSLGSVTWLLSTKVKRFHSVLWRITFFLSLIAAITVYYIWFVTAPVYNNLIPFMQNRIAHVHMSDKVIQKMLFANTTNLMLFFLVVPTLAVFLIMLWLSKIYTKHHNEFNASFLTYEYKTPKLQWLFKEQDADQYPDVVLGPNKKNKELVIQKGRDRTLNTAIVGPIGTGKTSSLILPIINQDISWMTKFINDFPKIYRHPDYHTEKVKGMYLNGISVIEPSNDLCKKVYQLAQAHNVPEESIWYFDPTDPNTPSINPFKGPVDKVAEAVTMVIEGVGENNNFFFQQSQRNHLKNYIYLMKLHDQNYNPTFQNLIRMYSNAQVVRAMHVKLKATIPDNYHQLEDRDERNHWSIVKGVDEWFDSNLLPELDPRSRQPILVQDGEFRGQQKYFDAEREFVKGLRNILDDMSTNILMRRVLFEESDFDFDVHLESGGLLLCNTAKGELGSLSNILGKFVLLSLQNAVFRRAPDISTFHHIVIDEFPDFVYEPFKEFPAQSRKYKTIITIASQTLSQLAMKFSDHYMQTLLGTMRHKMVFGDLTPFDAKLFSQQFGEDDEYEENSSEQVISPMQDNPSNRSGISYSKKREPIMSPDKLIYQEPFECSVKLVEGNRPLKVQQITSNFIPKEEFKRAKFLVVEKSGALWLEERNRLSNDTMDFEIITNTDDLEPIQATDENIPLDHLVNETPPASIQEKETDVERMLNMEYGRQPIDTPTKEPVKPLKHKTVEIEKGHEENYSERLSQSESVPSPRIRTKRTATITQKEVAASDNMFDTSWDAGLFDHIETGITEPEELNTLETEGEKAISSKEQRPAIEVNNINNEQKEMIIELLDDFYPRA